MAANVVQQHASVHSDWAKSKGEVFEQSVLSKECLGDQTWRSASLAAIRASLMRAWSLREM